MPILESDVILLKSRNMTDMDEGGGAATGELIVDNVSNNIFADIPELSRIIGEVSLRQVYLGVQTNDTDAYRGARVAIGKPPGDPRVSALLFKTRDFDVRPDMQSRIESYLSRGPKWGGYLYDNHIEGQGAIVLLQRPDAELPAIGKTLVLIGNEGLGTEYEQFVRITRVTSRIQQFTIATDTGIRTFSRAVVTCEISDTLRHDFAGVPATDLDTGSEFTGKAVLRDTVVADAARYYGAAPLTSAAALGDLSVRVASVYASLVPSAQTETPIADSRPNQRLLAVQQAGESAISFTVTATLSPTSSLYVGGAIYPGTLSIAIAGGATLTDSGGALRNGTTIVGSVDYTNGVLTSPLDGQTFSGSMTISYVPAGVPTVPTETVSIPVTAESRSSSLSVILYPIPAPGTLTVSFMAGESWYVLTDNGAGALRGAETTVGAGNLSFVTGSLITTFGALPDVGSDILLSWATTGFHEAIPAASTRAYFTGSLGQITAPGSLTLTWGDKSATDDGKGGFAGDGTGFLDYATGDFELAPNVIPMPGEDWTATFSDAATAAVGGTLATFTDLGQTWEGSLGSGFQAGGFSAEVQIQYSSNVAGSPVSTARRRIVDDGAGKLLLVTQSPAGAITTHEIGTINAGTGLMSITKGITLSSQVYYVTEYVRASEEIGYVNYPITNSWTAYSYATVEQGSPALINIRYTAGAGTAKTAVGTFGSLCVRIPKPGSASLVSGSIVFEAGGHRYRDRLGRLLRDIDPATGAGADVGPMDYIDGVASLSLWPGLTEQPIALQAALVQFGDVLVTGASFRTPIAPLRPASLSVAATRRRDGAVIVAGADSNGNINTADAVGIVKVQTGVARVWFRKAAGTAEELLDLTSLGIPGVTTIYVDPVYADTLRFGATGYTYMPLNADDIGLDPVRLPSDGRVPIFRPGDVAIAHHTTTTVPAAVINGQTLSCGRTRLARLRVIGSDGLVITAGYTADLDAGTAYFNNVSGYAQPVQLEHMIKDEAQVSDAQISGYVTLKRPLTHDFPAGSILSSALIVGTLFARVPRMFDQQSWTGVWSDDLLGSPLSANYNDIAHPLVVTNIATITERWAIRFKSTTTFELIGEHVGFIAEGNVTEDFSPLNPAVGLPYLTIRAAGWGGGWPQGGVLRLNTVGALFPLGLARTTQQGDATLTDDSFTLMILGDRDRT